MEIGKRRVWLALLMLVALASAAVLLSSRPAPPQVITLPNGEHYQFIAAEWGTNEVQPTLAARLVARLPAPLANFVMRKLGRRLGIVTIFPRMAFGPTPLKPPDPLLHFWFRSVQTNSAALTNSFKFMLADKDGVVGGMGNGGWSTCGDGKNKWLTFTLAAAPRRSDTLQLFLFRADDEFKGPFRQTGTVRFQNPLFGHFSSWQPEPVPATKSAGDLQVRLTDFTVAAANSGNGNEIASINGTQTRFHPPAPGENREAVFKLDIHSPRGTNEAWLVQPAQLSDATGNRVQTDFCSRWGVTDEYHFGPALWPDESAWRLTLTLRRFRGYDSEQVVTFTNVPVPAVGMTNIFFRTNSIHGVPVVLKQEFIREPDRTPAVLWGSMSATHVVVELVNHPDGFVVDFVQLNENTGWKPKEWSNGHTANSATLYLFSIPADVRTLDLSWAVQKVRTVEFLMKPPKPE
jgi:hypothetical protein